MEPFRNLTAIAAPIDLDNVDTDQIIPARLMRRRRINRNYGPLLLHDMRFDDNGNEKPDFILNCEPFRHAKIIVGARNYGCGSSRLGAVYVHLDFGIRAIIAVGFGEVFFNNCFKNGILPIRLDADICSRLRQRLHAAPGTTLSIDLEAQTVTGPDGEIYDFAVDPFGKKCLIEGLDDISLTLTHEDRIRAFEQDYRREMDWLGTEHRMQ